MADIIRKSRCFARLSLQVGGQVMDIQYEGKGNHQTAADVRRTFLLTQKHHLKCQIQTFF